MERAGSETGYKGHERFHAKVPLSETAETRADARIALVLAVSEPLADPSEAHADFRGILNRSGYSAEDVQSTFGSTDDLVVALAERRAFLHSLPLVRSGHPSTLAEVRNTLTAFGLVAWKEYSTTLAGFVRELMAEGTRNPSLKKRVYEAEPAAVTLQPREYLAEANDRGILAISDAQLYAEQLMVLLREPLYQELVLNPAPSPGEAAADRVEASIERFVQGCAAAERPLP
jgi:MFS transporter, DHA2 family, multidrug resistance protein